MVPFRYSALTRLRASRQGLLPLVAQASVAIQLSWWSGEYVVPPQVQAFGAEFLIASEC